LDVAQRLRGAVVRVVRGQDEIPAYRVLAPSGGAPGLVLVHEAFGLNDHIMDLAHRFAAEGFNVIAPDLYWRTGKPDPSDMESVKELMFGLRDDVVTQELLAMAEHLRGLDGSGTAVACIGFCAGGRNALVAACRGDGFAAAVDCWGGFLQRATPEALVTEERPVPPVQLVAGLRCPLLVIRGEEDENPSAEDLMALSQAFPPTGPTAHVVEFGEAGHAFLADYRPSYRSGPAHAAWTVIREFLQTHVGGPSCVERLR
jgi:carboxymethylenebutenolidase